MVDGWVMGWMYHFGRCSGALMVYGWSLKFVTVRMMGYRQEVWEGWL
jgi:hypothetical protein